MVVKTSNSSSIIALVDCNNFYVSCERVFQPHLEHQAMIVLSSNDGCVIARSNETKALGIRMGEPFFQIKDKVEKHQIQVFSSNYALYGDMSERVFNVLYQSAPQVEIYSVDEAFLDLNGITESQVFAKNLVQKIRQWTGIPVSIGIAPTKTLAKAANHLIKKQKIPDGTLMICDILQQTEALSQIPVEAVWGVGRKTAEKLKPNGIETALQLRDIDVRSFKYQPNIMLARTILELQGKPMFNFELNPAMRKQIIVSRSFGEKVSYFPDIRSAVVSHITSAAETLREENLVAEAMVVFLQTNRFNADHYHHTTTVILPIPTNFTKDLILAALSGLKKIYRRDVSYRKAGIILYELSSERQRQFDLFDVALENNRGEKLMNTLDDINAIHGRRTLRYCSEGFEKAWLPRSTKRSPPYTTCWKSLPRV